METPEGKSPAELKSSSEVLISSKVLNEVAEETKARSKEKDDEFLVFILDNGNEQITTRVGIGHSSGVSYTPAEAINTLKPFIDQGFKIMADYHNHPGSTLKVYDGIGLKPEYSLSPSFADLWNDTQTFISRELNQKEYPHLIGIYIPQTEKVHINGFNYIREPAKEEEKDVQFEDPFFIEEAPDELDIQIHASQFTNPAKLLEKGIIKNVTIKSDSTLDASVILNTEIH